MSRVSILRARRTGITVLGLLLLIIALMVGGFFLVRYLRSRPATAHSFLPHEPLDELNLSGVIEVVGGDAVDFLRVGPHPLG